jgi:hypothetical protein
MCEPLKKPSKLWDNFFVGSWTEGTTFGAANILCFTVNKNPFETLKHRITKRINVKVRLNRIFV